MKNKFGFITFLILFIPLAINPPMRRGVTYIGFRMIYTTGHNIEIVRFLVYLALIIIISLFAQYFLPSAIDKSKAKILSLLNHFKIHLIKYIILIVSLVAATVWVIHYLNEAKKVYTEFHSIKLTDNLKTIRLNKGQPAQSEYLNNDSTGVHWVYHLYNTYGQGGYAPYNPANIYVLILNDTVGYVLQDRNPEGNNMEGIELGNSYNYIIQEYGDPTFSKDKDNWAVVVYGKYNLLFEFEGNGRENKRVIRSGVVNYQFMKSKGYFE